jgi:hypothetical protein
VRARWAMAERGGVADLPAEWRAALTL